MPRINSNETLVFNTNENPIIHGRERVEYIASVKNTPEGKDWIKQLRKLNPDFNVVVFTTGSNRREKFESAGKEMKTYKGVDVGDRLPVSVADRFRVYVKTRPNYGEWSTNLSLIEIVLP